MASARLYYYAAAAVAVLLLLLAFYAWRQYAVAHTSLTQFKLVRRPPEKMSAGAHWAQAGTYGRTADTLPAYGLSGYYADVPTEWYA
jgi:hypothetical protein